MTIVCPPAGVAAGAIYTAIDVGGAIKGEYLISGRKLSDEERLTCGAFAIVPGAGGLAAKSVLKHMPALGTVMKTVSKTMDDAVKPIKSKVDHLTITGKQAVKTTVAKTQQQALKATDSVKLVKQNLTLTGKQALKTTHKKVSQATNSVKSAKQSMETSINKTLENAKQLGKAHLDQLKFAVAHPIIATVTSKAGQKSIRGTASIIDDVKRPFYIKSMEAIGGPKIPVGIERGPSNDVIKNMGEDLISRMQAEKDAIKGIKGIDNVKDITKLTVDDIPTAKSGNFNKFFNSLTISELDELWKDKKIRKKIERQLREPGGLHEWHLVSRAPQFKYWNIGAEEIKDLRTAISDVKFVNPNGVHGGLGSTKAHNELLAIIDTSSDYNTFVRRLNNWANYRLEGGVSSLPQGLRLK